MEIKSFQEWIKNMANIGWALFKSYLYQCKNPLNYQVVTKSSIYVQGVDMAVSEEVTFVGVVQDIPDVTPHSIMHKWVVIKTFYGEWKDDNNSST